MKEKYDKSGEIHLAPEERQLKHFKRMMSKERFNNRTLQIGREDYNNVRDVDDEDSV